MKYKISKARYESLTREQTAIIVDVRRKIVVYQRREENANIPKN